MRDDYIQHNPFFKDGKQGFIDGVTTWNLEHPKAKLEVRRTTVENDLVIVHARVVEPGQPDQADIEIFRIHDGLIAEHWDVVQDVPPLSHANENGMF